MEVDVGWKCYLLMSWVKVFRINAEFRILRQITMASPISFQII